MFCDAFLLFCFVFLPIQCKSADFIEFHAQMKHREQTADRRFVNSLNAQRGRVHDTRLPLMALDDIFIVFLTEPFRRKK